MVHANNSAPTDSTRRAKRVAFWLGVALSVATLSVLLAGGLTWLADAREAKAGIATKADIAATLATAVADHEAAGHPALRAQVQAIQERTAVLTADMKATDRAVDRLTDEVIRLREAIDRMHR